MATELAKPWTPSPTSPSNKGAILPISHHVRAICSAVTDTIPPMPRAPKESQPQLPSGAAATSTDASIRGQIIGGTYTVVALVVEVVEVLVDVMVVKVRVLVVLVIDVDVSFSILVVLVPDVLAACSKRPPGMGVVLAFIAEGVTFPVEFVTFPPDASAIEAAAAGAATATASAGQVRQSVPVKATNPAPTTAKSVKQRRFHFVLLRTSTASWGTTCLLGLKTASATIRMQTKNTPSKIKNTSGP
mmetsp:Transcript_39706/g.64182  ORF Transcript_39706/g.64182 Transcript_39706/m.64182 type:complete len:245 (+) Transcript_39706:240-974(+)